MLRGKVFTIAACLWLAAQASFGAIITDDGYYHNFIFSGTAQNGVGSANMSLKIDQYTVGAQAYTKITSWIDNTSPVFSSTPLANAPGITGWGFDTSPQITSSSDVVSWTISAFTAAATQITLGVNGGGSSNLWNLELGENFTKFNLDMVSDNSLNNEDVKRALYNPLSDPAYHNPDAYYTRGQFEVVLLGTVDVVFDDSATQNDKNLSPVVRFQNVGDDGEGSLALGPSTHTTTEELPPAPSATVPEPATLAMWGFGLGVAGLVRMVRRRK